MKKKLFFAVIAVISIIVLCSINISAAKVKEGIFTYSVTNGEATITDCSVSVGQIVIPDTIGGYPVTGIGGAAFEYDFNIESITIPDGVTSIGNRAFYCCESLVSISIPNSVTNMGNYVFYNCCNLKNITLSDNVTSIGNYAFNGCGKLESITIPGSVVSIGTYAFSGCKNLKSVTFCDGITSIGGSAFDNCDSLESVVLPSSVTSIDISAFCSCDSLKSATILGNVTNIENYTFSSCVSLESVILPDSVTGIGYAAFSRCSSLKSITIPENVTSIDNHAFSNCSNLVNITISDGVTSIGEAMFSKCSALKYVSLPAGIKNIDYIAFEECPNIEVVFYAGSESQWKDISFGEGNESLTNTKIVYNVSKKTYRFETNCDTKLPDIIGNALFAIPVIKNNDMTFLGWYDNEEFKGETVTFPYYGDATTLYAAWANRSGKNFDDALIVKSNKKYNITTTENGQLVYFEFVPKLSKEYHFYTTGSKDTYGYLYNSSQSCLTSNDDGGDGNNFYISYNLTAGQTYYIAAKIYSGTGTFTFVVEEPVDYRINEITIKDMSGNSLQAIPEGIFLATVSFTNISSSEDTVIILAQYTATGAYKGLIYIQTEDVPTGSTIKLSIPVDNSNGDVAKLKAFCLESFSSLTPMGDSVAFPAE